MKLFKHKTIFFLLIIAALALIGLGLSRDANLNKESERFLNAERVPTDKIDSIKIEKAGQSATLIKKDGKWEVEEGENGIAFPASPQKIAAALDALRGYELADIVSRNPAKYAQFNVDESSSVAVYFSQGKSILLSLYVGKSDYRRGGDYVRYGGAKRDAAPAIYITKAPLRSYFESTGSFKDLSIFSSSEDGIKKIAWEYKSKADSFSVVKKTEKKDGKNSSLWVFDGAENKATKDSAVSEFIATLTNSLADDIILAQEGADYGFSDPSLTLEITMEKGDAARIVFGNKQDGKDATVYYARMKGREQWAYRFQENAINQLAKKISDFTN